MEAGRVGKKRNIVTIMLTFQRQDWIFASTDGAYATQTIYTSLGGVPHSDDMAISYLAFTPQDASPEVIPYLLPSITPTGAGYEVLEDAARLNVGESVITAL